MPRCAVRQPNVSIAYCRIGGQIVHLVDISGTFREQLGPFAPATVREEYRMLAAIIKTDKQGQYFVKYYGPAATVAAGEDAFMKMLGTLKVSE